MNAGHQGEAAIDEVAAAAKRRHLTYQVDPGLPRTGAGSRLRQSCSEHTGHGLSQSAEDGYARTCPLQLIATFRKALPVDAAPSQRLPKNIWRNLPSPSASLIC